ncbi:MAG TPA: hypothetical protein VF609_03170 [Flavisolibacter sp.]
MKQAFPKQLRLPVMLFFSTVLLLFSYLLLCSFATNKMADDLFKQLGISKTGADEKIGNSILGGSIDLYGVKNAKNIALGNRKAVVLDLLAHTKQYVNTPAFIKKYNTEIRDHYRPKEYIPQTPEAMRAENIRAAKEGVAKMEETVKKADANTKPIFLKVLEDAKKNVVAAEDPNNKHIVAYTKNYPDFVKSSKEDYQRQLAEFERKYPTNQLLYVKMRLQEFMEETKDIDFGAGLVSKNGKKYFVNRAYESKGNRWKMAFRAGKEVIEPAREAVQKWIDEIK